jgi:hypothetical protein
MFAVWRIILLKKEKTYLSRSQNSKITINNMKKLSWLLVVTIATFACEPLGVIDPLPDDQINSGAATVGGVVGIVYSKNVASQGGNIRCADLPVSYSYSVGDDGVGGIDASLVNGYAWPQGFSISTDGTNVTWSFTPYVDANGRQWCLAGVSFLVKGGNATNVYTYGADATGDSGLHSPINNGGNVAALSNFGFCYSLYDCTTVTPCYQDETAWAAGKRYTTKGNWATYVEYTGAAKSVTLLAGQTHNAGSVSFSAVSGGMVTITISFTGGWGLNPNASEGVKIQGYNTAPSGNPAPGQFTTYKGNNLTVTVPSSKFFGVHVDVSKEITCP